MNWSKWIRRFHRWMSVIFTGSVIVVFVSSLRDDPAERIFYLPLAPLALMLVSGLYLFALPYVRQRPQNPSKTEHSE